MVGIGTVLIGRYRLDHQIGRGGFATVFLGTDLGPLGRQVAIKVLKPALAEDSTFLARFENEARRVATLDHPNILTAYDYGHIDETAFLVMPYINGGTLHEKLRQERYLALPAVSNYLRQAAVALDYAHAHRLIHRDVKPQNMLLRGDGHLYLADFGVSKAVTETQSSTQGVTGTVAYMAPEAWRGHIGRATDVYALGCTVFEMLTGSPPYRGTTEQVMYNHLEGAIPSVTERSHGRVPVMFQDLFDTALAKRASARFRQASDFAEAFEAILAHADATTLPATARQDATRMEATVSNPHYYRDLTLLERSWRLSDILSTQTILLVTGAQLQSELLDRPVAELLRDEVDSRGNISQFWRGIVMSDVWWYREVALQKHPAIAIGSPLVNGLTAEIVSKGEPWNYSGVQGCYNSKPSPRIALWGISASQTRQSVDDFIRNPTQGLANFLTLCWGKQT